MNQQNRLGTKIGTTRGRFFLLALMLCMCLPVQAAMIGFQSQAAFNAAIAGWSSNLTNFEAQSVGTMYAVGTGPAGSGMTFTLGGPDAPALDPTVADQFWTTSGTHYLGLNNSDTAFQAGDFLTINFGSAVQAFGLFIIGGSDLLGGDISLDTGADSIANAGVAELTDGNGSYAYFLGFVSNDASTFNSVTLRYTSLQPPSLLPIALDDMVWALHRGGTQIPLPATPFLMIMGLVVLTLNARRNNPSHQIH